MWKEWRTAKIKHNRVFRLLASLTVVVLCMTAFSVTAFAGGGDGDYYTGEPAETTPEPTEESATGGMEPEPEPEPEKESGSSGGALVLILLLAVPGGGGAFAYIKFIKPKQGAKVSADTDDYEFEDEEYENEENL